jgi:uncharacterized protein (UPF0548 family)
MVQLVKNLESTQPTYSDLGATLNGERPEGFRHDRYEAVLGSGPEAFERAAKGLQEWQAHSVAGIRVFPADSPIEKGATVVVTLGTSLVALAAPCRIVEVIEDEDRWGFAYGTLPGHPEQGEEAFVVSRSSNRILFEVTAFSRPGDPLVRLSGPLGRGIQRAGTKGYLRALKRFVGEEAD